MNKLSHKVKVIVVFSVAAVMLFVGVFASVVYANHSWGGYHWARTSNPFTLKIGDNVSSKWDSYLDTASGDWSLSSVLDTIIVSGQNKASCRATNGRVEVCNKTYGRNGWLGVAQIWIDSSGHITQGTVKMNDTYFNTSTYNTPAWRNLVMCQEIGHTLGLDHQDEIFDNPNLGTCMDYTNDPSANQHPNQHDYAQLEAIYTHLDSTTILGSTVLPKGKGNGVEVNLDDSSAWGKGLRKDSKGNNSLFGRDLGNGDKLFTFVIWAN
ncbi:MAG: hypothetical protein AAB352_01715 [Patescibacteria group bacterium]